MRKTYVERTYLDQNPIWHAQDALWKADKILAMAARHKLVPNSVREVGCGSGQILATLAGAWPKAEMIGYDISPHLKQTFWDKVTAKNVRFEKSDFITLEKDKAELIVVADVIEHVEDIYGFLKGIKRAGATYIFHIPLDIHVQGILRHSYMAARARVGHIHYFTRLSALAALKDSGYEIIDELYTPGALESPEAQVTLLTRMLNMLRRLTYPVFPHQTVILLGGYSLLVLAKVPGKK